MAVFGEEKIWSEKTAMIYISISSLNFLNAVRLHKIIRPEKRRQGEMSSDKL